LHHLPQQQAITHIVNNIVNVIVGKTTCMEVITMANTAHCTVPIENTKMLADALKAAGVTVEYDLLAGVGHGETGSTPVFESDASVKSVVAFFDAHVK
jgi:acetyl esterase/lipase